MSNPRTRLSNLPQSAFTLIEAMLAIAVLGITVAGIAVLYTSGKNASHAQIETLRIQGALRSRAELMMSQPFDSIADSSNTVVIALGGGESRKYGEITTVTLIDLDGDNIPEPDAKQITISLEGRSTSMIIVDDRELVGKL